MREWIWSIPDPGIRLRFLLAVAVEMAVDFFMKKPQEVKFLACCGCEGKSVTSATIPTTKTETEKVCNNYTWFQVLPWRLGPFIFFIPRREPKEVQLFLLIFYFGLGNVYWTFRFRIGNPLFWNLEIFYLPKGLRQQNRRWSNCFYLCIILG